MSPELAVQMELGLVWVGFLFIVGMNVWHIKSDMRMHQAHARMINMLLDELIERKKGDVAQAIVDRYRADIKLKPKGVVH